MNNRVESSSAEVPNDGYGKRSKDGHGKAMKKRKIRINKD
jgi:hypothetical protein